MAIAMVQTEDLRPAFMPPWTGQNFFLAGYRIFARYRTTKGRALRGLRILRSDANRRLMVLAGNRLTHYQYRLARVMWRETPRELEIKVSTLRAEADLELAAFPGEGLAPLPPGSPFPDHRTARLFAGPLPFTFDYERETHSIVLIEGERDQWSPKPIEVAVRKVTFFNQTPFNAVEPILANAFLVSGIPYRWKRGVRETLPERYGTNCANK